MRYIQILSLASLFQSYLTLGSLLGDAHSDGLYRRGLTDFELYRREVAYLEDPHLKRQLLFGYLEQAHLQRRGKAPSKFGIAQVGTSNEQNGPSILPLTNRPHSPALSSINVHDPPGHAPPAPPPPAPPHPPPILKPNPAIPATLPGGRPLNLAVKHESHRGVITDAALRQTKKKLTRPKTNEEEIRAAAEERRKAAVKGKGKGMSKENSSSFGSKLATLATVGAAVSGVGVAGWSTALSQQSLGVALHNQNYAFANTYHAGAISPNGHVAYGPPGKPNVMLGTKGPSAQLPAVDTD